jgi:hypothetical protein
MAIDEIIRVRGGGRSDRPERPAGTALRPGRPLVPPYPGYFVDPHQPVIAAEKTG